MQKRLVRVGNYKYSYAYPKGLFPSMAYQFKYLPIEKQVLDVETNGSELETIPFSELDRELTAFFRREQKRLSKVFPMGRLKRRPMLSYEDRASLLLPLDNQVGLDYLTYRHPLWQTLVERLGSRILRRDGSQGVQDAVKTWFVDYSVCVPFDSTVRHDGRFEVTDRQWSPAAIETYSAMLSVLLKEAILKAGAHLQDFAPSINSKKSLGWNQRLPDGEPVIPSKYLVGPEEWMIGGAFPEDLQRQGALIHDYLDVKLDWAESGRLQENFQFLLENGSRYDEPAVLFEAFMREAAAVHVIAYRENNADLAVADLPADLKMFWGACAPKDRDFAVEREEFSFSVGKVNSAAWESAMRAKNPSFRGTHLKKRSVFPAPNASINPPLIFFFRLCLKEVEESAAGFPSSRQIVLDRYKRNQDLYGHLGMKYFSMDRRTSEQFISDNRDRVSRMYPSWMRNLMKGVMQVILPGDQGVRVASGALASGSPPTTFCNAIVGVFEVSNVIAAAEDLPPEKVIPIVVNHIFTAQDAIKIGRRYYLLNLGTDDQVFVYFGPLIQIPETFFDERRLSHETGEELSSPVFGLQFRRDGVSVSTTLGLNKVFLQEKTLFGDACAMKMFARLSLLPDFYDDIQAVFTELKLGTLSTYKLGADSYVNNYLKKFGYVGIDQLFSEHSPVERHILAQLSQRYPELTPSIESLLENRPVDGVTNYIYGNEGFSRERVVGQSGHYSLDTITPWYKTIIKILEA